MFVSESFNFPLASTLFNSNTFIYSTQEINFHADVLNNKFVYFNIRQRFSIEFLINDSMHCSHIRAFSYLILQE
jgi:hypothetical protein